VYDFILPYEYYAGLINSIGLLVVQTYKQMNMFKLIYVSLRKILTIKFSEHYLKFERNLQFGMYICMATGGHMRITSFRPT
jgi:hypothetical protein